MSRPLPNVIPIQKKSQEAASLTLIVYLMELKKQRTKKPKSASGKPPGVKLEVAQAVGVQTQ